jgi:hypothetical protein
MKKAGDEVSEEYRVAAVKFCRERDLNYTLGTMLEVARFAQQFCAKIDKALRLSEQHGAQAEIRLINCTRAKRALEIELWSFCECGQPENSIRHSGAAASSVDAHAFKPKP